MSESHGETGFLHLEPGSEPFQFDPVDPHRVLPLPILSRQICYEISTFILAHLMAMNLNGTQIPANGVRTTTLGIRDVCVGSNVRERERERKSDMIPPASCCGRGSRRSYLQFRVQRGG